MYKYFDVFERVHVQPNVSCMVLNFRWKTKNERKKNRYKYRASTGFERRPWIYILEKKKTRTHSVEHTESRMKEGVKCKTNNEKHAHTCNSYDIQFMHLISPSSC